MSQHPLISVLNAYKRRKTARPEGSYSLEEVAKRWGMSLENAKRTLAESKQAGLIQEVRGSKVTAAGQIQACVYYKLVKGKS